MLSVYCATISDNVYGDSNVSREVKHLALENETFPRYPHFSIMTKTRKQQKNADVPVVFSSSCSFVLHNGANVMR